MGDWMYPRLVYLGISLSWVVGQLHILAALPPGYPFDRKLGGFKCQSGGREEEKIFDPTGIRTPTLLSTSS
jgi:hypothetical protein